MNIKSLLLFISFFIIGNQVINSQSQTGGLPVFEVSKNYPQKEKRLHEIADIEYVPLETTDNVLLGDQAVLSAVSDNYILVHDYMRGDVFVFNRSGELYSHFNHKGQSGQEYQWIKAGTILDEKKGEIFVCSNSIQVYSLSGEYKRTLKVNTIMDELTVFDFDDESLLVYNEMPVVKEVYYQPVSKPYRFISKKDGSVLSVLNLDLPDRISASTAKLVNNAWQPTVMRYPNNMHYGQDLMIGDISSDTLYVLSRDKKLTPRLVRKPSVHESEPRTIWTTYLTTDKFIYFGTLLLDFNSKGGKIPAFMYEFETGEISKMKILDYDKRGWSTYSSPAIAKNMTAEFIQASSLIEAYKKKQLKGNVEFINTLTEDDNPVVRILTFKM